MLAKIFATHHSSRWVTIFTAIVIIILSLQSCPPVTAQNEQEPPPERPIYWTGEPIPVYQGEAESIPEEDPMPAYDAIGIPYSIIIYSSYYHDRWDLYRTDVNGSTVALTNDAAVDIHPSYNPGATKIAFASDRGGNKFAIYSLSANGTGLYQLTADTDDNVNPDWSPDGTKIAFETYRGGDPEVYVMNSDGSNQHNVSLAMGFDGQPAWSPDGTQIAFISYRSGGYRVWIVDADGRNPRQFNNESYSAYPAWSPDGKMIAYSADTNGDEWLEQIVRKTTGILYGHYYPQVHADYIVGAWSPGWSADNGRVGVNLIHWIFWQGQWWWERAENAVLDAYGKGWYGTIGKHRTDWYMDWGSQDIDPPNSEMITLPSISPYLFTVHWSGGDTQSGLWFYDVQVKDGANGAWTNWRTVTTQREGSYAGKTGHTYYFRVRAIDKHYNQEQWPAGYDVKTSIETAKPVSQVLLLPQFLRTTSIPLTVTANDPGNSGVSFYNIYVKDGSDAWKLWQRFTTPATEIYPGEYGHTYAFYTRAVDRAGNVEDVPTGISDTSTTVYRWAGSGVVVDNTGNPLPGVEYQVQPGVMISQNSDEEGFFSAMSGELVNSYTQSWTKAGYSTLPELAVDKQYDRTSQTIAMPPVNDLLINGTFEDELTGWTGAGTHPPRVDADYKVTGVNGVFMGSQAFGEIEDIPGIPGRLDYKGYKEIIGLDLSVHVFITQRIVDNQQDLLWIRRDPILGWQPAVRILKCEYLYNPWVGSSVEIGSDGTLHLFTYCSASMELEYRSLSATMNWSEPIILSDAINQIIQTDVLPDNSSAVYYCKGGNTCFLKRQNASGDWLEEESIPIPGDAIHIDFEKPFSYDPEMQPHIILNSGTIENFTYEHHWRTSDGAWHIETIRVPKGGANFGNILIYTKDGRLMFAYTCEAATCIISLSSDSVWTAPLVVSPNRYNDKEFFRDSFGGIHLWGISDYYHEIYYHYYSNGLDWAPFQRINWNNCGYSSIFNAANDTMVINQNCNINTPPYNSTVTIVPLDQSAWPEPVVLATRSSSWFPVYDSYGVLHHFSTLTDPPYIRYLPPERITEDHESTLSQQVTIPTDMPNPTLSFLYRLNGASELDNNGLFVTVDDGSGVEEILAIHEITKGWTHAHADLSAYAGRTVTLTFAAREKMYGDPVGVWLDDISLGSAYPDLWAGVYEPAGVQPGSEATFIVAHANLAGGASGPVTLSLTLPDGVTFVSADPVPVVTGTTLTWNLPGLPGKTAGGEIKLVLEIGNSIETGTLLEGTLEVVSPIPELVQENNVAPFRIWVGARVFLPQISR